MRDITSLDGWWDWSIPGGRKQKKRVPSSYFCVGEAEFERSFVLGLPAGKRAFLCFDGIAYQAAVRLNGINIGEMLPYVGYRFDVTPYLNSGVNHIKIDLKDISAQYGPSEGWECYGGIIRDVYIDIVDAVHIEDYQWSVEFSSDYEKASCHLKVYIRNLASDSFSSDLAVGLAYWGENVFSAVGKVDVDTECSTVEFDFDIDNPLLWSPQFPNLYDLLMEIRRGQAVVDSAGQKVGFREFSKLGSKFCLNGREIILKGVCRHDMWGDGQGFTLSRGQMEKDMQMIKDMGANYVRLVHYPHHKYIIEIADRLGLMVSEESGLWFSDLNDEVVVSSALEVMRRTVLRDRNNVSVVFWLAFNECIFTDEYLSRVKRMCNDLDPARMVSGANFMNAGWTRDMFTRHDIDFYTYHPYGHYPDGFVTGGYNGEKPNVSIEEVLRVFDDRPVLFTEWGGWPVRDNPGLLKNFGDSLIKFTRNRHPDPNLAGFCYWEWSDIYQVSRGYPACEDGILTEGLVDVNRNKRVIYYVMSDIFSRLGQVEERKETVVLLNHVIELNKYSEYKAIDLSGLIDTEQQADAWRESLERAVAENKREHKKPVLAGPVLEKEIVSIGEMPVNINSGQPLVLTGEHGKIEIKVGSNAAYVHFFGHITFAEGYPVKGKFGEEIAKYVLSYEDGSLKEIILTNGIDFTAANTIWGPSRINPVASNVRTILKIIIDDDWEVYQINHSTVDADREKVLDAISFELLNPEYSPLLYGITIEM